MCYYAGAVDISVGLYTLHVHSYSRNYLVTNSVNRISQHFCRGFYEHLHSPCPDEEVIRNAKVVATNASEV